MFVSDDNLIHVNEFSGKMIDYVRCLTCNTERSKENTFYDISLPISGCNSLVRNWYIHIDTPYEVGHIPQADTNTSTTQGFIRKKTTHGAGKKRNMTIKNCE